MENISSKFIIRINFTTIYLILKQINGLAIFIYSILKLRMTLL